MSDKRITFEEAFKLAIKEHPLPEGPLTVTFLMQHREKLISYIEKLNPESPFEKYLEPAVAAMRKKLDEIAREGLAADRVE